MEEERQNRQEEIRAAVLTWHSIASLDADARQLALEKLGLNSAMLEEQSQAATLCALYAGVIELAGRLGDWEQALDMVRDTDVTGARPNEVWAYNKLIHQTAELYL